MGGVTRTEGDVEQMYKVGAAEDFVDCCCVIDAHMPTQALREAMIAWGDDSAGYFIVENYAGERMYFWASCVPRYETYMRPAFESEVLGPTEGGDNG